jgi:DNA (cytosine-5)-methyltransferase 1
MRYLSVCSGIEAASVAWEPLGWTPVGFSEIEPFPCKVLQHHYPNVKNYGDMTKYKEWDIDRDSVDLLVGGTPCQAFSVAGLRKGLEDPRGNLSLVFVGMVEHFKPEWVVWENVPGVLSSNGGRDFGSFIGALANIGYGFSWRCLDAKHFGVPQRRRRIFLVGHSSGDPRRAAEVLFEPEGLRGNFTKSRKTGEDTARCLTTGTDIRYDWETETLVPVMYENHPNDSRITGPVDPSPTVAARWGTGGGNTPLVQHTFRKSRRAQSTEDYETWIPDNVTNTLNCFDIGDIRSVDIVTAPIPIQDVRPIDKGQNGLGIGKEGDPSYTLDKMATQGVAQAFNHQSGGDMRGIELRDLPQLQACQQTSILHKMAVRRLTPTECERLQGFPDGYTDIRPNGKDTPDGPRYKALGNSMAVPCMRWLGKRIQGVSNRM